MITVIPYYPPSFSNPFWDVTIAFLRRGLVTYNVGWVAGLRGFVSAVPYLVLVAALIVWLVRELGRRAAIAFLVAALHVGLFAYVPHEGSAQTLTNMIVNWEPR